MLLVRWALEGVVCFAGLIDHFCWEFLRERRPDQRAEILPGDPGWGVNWRPLGVPFNTRVQTPLLELS